MNEHSSRSHVIFTITIECCDWGPDKQQHIRMGKLHLVDLAVRSYHLTIIKSCNDVLYIYIQQISIGLRASVKDWFSGTATQGGCQD